MPRWVGAGVVWLILSVGLGLLFAIGGQALLGFTVGRPFSVVELTQRGQLLPGTTLLSLAGIIAMLRKPANTSMVEREILGVCCLAVAVPAAAWWGQIMTLYQFKQPVDALFVSGGSRVVYGFCILVGGLCVV